MSLPADWYSAILRVTSPNQTAGVQMSRLRIAILALAGMLAGVLPAGADSGIVRITFLKAGFVIGGAAGSGNLEFRGRMYRLSVGGLSYGFTFGGSQTLLRGRVRNINHPDVSAAVTQV